jgi:hypothetical protein
VGVRLIQEGGSRQLERGHQRMKGNESAAKKTNEIRNRAREGRTKSPTPVSWIVSIAATMYGSWALHKIGRCSGGQERKLYYLFPLAL